MAIVIIESVLLLLAIVEITRLLTELKEKRCKIDLQFKEIEEKKKQVEDMENELLKRNLNNSELEKSLKSSDEQKKLLNEQLQKSRMELEKFKLEVARLNFELAKAEKYAEVIGNMGLNTNAEYEKLRQENLDLRTSLAKYDEV